MTDQRHHHLLPGKIRRVLFLCDLQGNTDLVGLKLTKRLQSAQQ